jgi:hypothetical protein
MNSAFTKFQRLRSMDSDELWHRVRQRWQIEMDRVRFHSPLARREDPALRSLLENHSLSMKSLLQAGPAQRFYAAAAARQRERMAGFVTHHFPEWLKRTIQEAERLCAHQIDLLGLRGVKLDPKIDWMRDPVSGYQWPRRFWANYDLGNTRSCDSKVVHELNRHQHLPRLAKAFFLTGDERYAREAIAQIESWIDQNPPGCGINWQSSLEIAIRAISWMWTVFLLLSSHSLDENAARRIAGSLFRQLEHVYRYPSTYTSPNTHLIGEAAALFMGGLVFSEHPLANQWRSFGAATLVNEMARQVSSEGVYREASSYYHCYTTDFYVQTLSLARANRFQFPDWMWRRVSQMLEYVLHLSRPDGSLPLVGDDDGGRALAFSRSDYSSYRDGLSCGAVLFGRSDFKYAAHSFCEETLWLLGQDSFNVFESLNGRPSNALHRFYPESGCFIQRSDPGPAASHLVFDCGNLGMLSGGHGHADALSFTLFAQGTELLIDPGTSVYNCAPQWRDYFRSTRAHNTVVVDGCDQSTPAGTFSWKHKAGSRLLDSRNLPGVDYIDGEHDGYALDRDIVHRRRLLFVRPDYWIVLDQLEGRGQHTFDFLHHFAPGAQLFVLGDESRGDVDCRVLCGPASLHLYMYASAPVRTEAVCGQVDPIQGWASSRYGQRQSSPMLSASVESAAPVSMMTFLTPTSDPSDSRRLGGLGANVIAASLRDRENDDVCVFSPESQEVHVQDYAMRGELFWLRTQEGLLRQVIAINATRFALRRETIFESEAPIPYVVVHLWENGMVIERGENEGQLYVRDLRYRQFQRN